MALGLQCFLGFKAIRPEGFRILRASGTFKLSGSSL